MKRTRFSCGLLALVLVAACEQPGMNPSGQAPKAGAAGEVSNGGAAGEVSNGGAAGQPFTGVPLGHSSWDVTLSVVPSDPSVPDLGCEALPQTLVLEPESDGLGAVLGTYGVFHTRGAARALGTFSAAELTPNERGYQTRSLDVTCAMTTVHLSELSLIGLDADSDGVPQRIKGTGSGHAWYWFDDYGVPFDFEFALSGSPDRTPPSVFLTPNTEESNPFDALRVDATEPLTPETRVSLAGDTEIVFTSEPSPADTHTVFKSEVIRPFSSSWTLKVDGHDQGGLSVSSTITHVTQPDPGLLVTDGFEGGPALEFADHSRVLDTINNLPALNGNRCLFVYPGSTVTLHLARPAGANHVRFSARLLSDTPAPNVLPVVAGVIGGVERVYPREFPHVFEDTGSTFLRYVAATEEADLVLTEPGDHVALRVAPQTPTCSTNAEPCVGRHGVMLDDLRIE